ncbi:MAG: hypothetical protein WC965_01135 [Thiohalomonadaceae bacterium]
MRFAEYATKSYDLMKNLGGNMLYNVTNIEWETDGEDVELPTELLGLEVEVSDLTDELSDGLSDYEVDCVLDKLSDLTGWLVYSCAVERA